MVQNARNFYKVRDVELMLQNARTFYKVRDVELMLQNARTFYKVRDVELMVQNARNFYKVWVSSRKSCCTLSNRLISSNLVVKLSGCEGPHHKTSNLACALGKDSDQTA